MRARLLLVAAAYLLAWPGPIRAQTDASLAVGSGTVRYPDGTSLGLVSVVPTLQFTSPYRQFVASTGLSRLSQGSWYGQGQIGTWLATHRLVGSWQLGADLDLRETVLQRSSGTGAGRVTVEALWGAPRWGVAAGGGGATGWVRGTTAPHARLRGWWQLPSGNVTVSGDVEPTRFLGSWYTDIDAALAARLNRLNLRVWTSSRVSSAYGSKAAAVVSADVHLSSLISLEVSGGSVLPDPFQGFPRSGFISAGMRIHVPLRTERGYSGVLSSEVRIVRREDALTLHVRQHGARSVLIAGDWNGWSPTALDPIGSDWWETVLKLPAGIYHFSLTVDGTAWTIPAGVPTVPDGMGGRVAVLTVL
jgi:hypothetical protein